MSRFILLVACLVLPLLANPALAQGKFSPELQVGDRVVTRYQIDQRARLLSLLGAPGETRELAREQLINEAVQWSAAARAEVEVSAEGVAAGMDEFSARANLTTEQVLQIMTQAGIAPETFRDFIGASVAWRETVRGRFTDEIRATIPQSLIQRRLAKTGTEGGIRMLLSEILLPANTPEAELASRERAAELTALQDANAFAAAARRFSVANSASRGGEMNWTDLERLPEDVQAVVANLAPGQISRPLEIENAIAIFLVREIERVESGVAADLQIDYALFTPEAGQVTAVLGRVDVCDDLYGEAKGLPEDRLIRETKSQSALPADIRAAFEGLDDNETAVLTRNGAPAILMLCARNPGGESTVDFDIVGTQLFNTRLTTSALHYLTELRAGTTVIDLTN